MTTGPLPVPPPPTLPPIFSVGMLGGIRDVLELLLIEQQVGVVHKILEDQITAIKGTTFDTDAVIPAASFGLGVESTTLASEHDRAHGVIIESLEEMLVDLGVFQDAILEAKKLIWQVDEQAESELRVALAQTDALDLGYYDSDEPLPSPTPGPGDATDPTGGTGTTDSTGATDSTDDDTTGGSA